MFTSPTHSPAIGARTFLSAGAGLLACLLALALPLIGCGEKSASNTDAAKESAPAKAPPSVADWPIFRGDAALTGVAHGELTTPLELLWSFKTGGPVNSSAVVADGRVFFGSGDSNVYCLNLQSGAKLWSFKAGDIVEAPPLALNGRIFVSSSDGVLHALDASNGNPLWKYQTGDKILASANWFTSETRSSRREEAPSEAGSKASLLTSATNLLIGSYDYLLHCVDAATGRSNWVYETGNYINGTPAIADGRTVFGGCDAMLHLIAVADGQKLAEIPAGAYVAASVALADDLAFYGHYENEFQCVDLRGGTNVWTFRDRQFPYLSSAAVTTNRVLFGGRDKRLHCINRTDGKPVWQFATRGKVDSSPVVCGDKVIVGSDDGRLYVVSLADGQELWSYEVGQAIGTSPAIAGGKIIVGSEDGSVYCFGEK